MELARHEREPAVQMDVIPECQAHVGRMAVRLAEPVTAVEEVRRSMATRSAMQAEPVVELVMRLVMPLVR